MEILLPAEQSGLFCQHSVDIRRESLHMSVLHTFDVFVGGGECGILLLHHLDCSPILFLAMAYTLSSPFNLREV